MMIHGHIDHIFATDIETRRGTVTLTSVWIVDRHDYHSPTKQAPAMYEVQFLDDKIHSWEAVLTERFNDGDRVLAVVKDDLETAVSVDQHGNTRAYIKARGLDLAASTIDAARAQRTRD